MVANPERHRARAKAYHAANRDAIAAHVRGKKYGLTNEVFEALLAEQLNACAICEREFINTPYSSPYVDHCHATNRVRGLLCNSCNRALGWFKDNPALLRSAIRYLIAHEGT